MNALDALPSDAHRAMLRHLRQSSRGRSRSIPRDKLRASLLAEYGITLVDRDMRQIRRDLLGFAYPCYPGPEGYHYGVEAADLQDARAYLVKKIIPLQEEWKWMGEAFESEMRRQRNEGQTQMDLPIKMVYPMGQQTVRVR